MRWIRLVDELEITCRYQMLENNSIGRKNNRLHFDHPKKKLHKIRKKDIYLYKTPYQ